MPTSIQNPSVQDRQQKTDLDLWSSGSTRPGDQKKITLTETKPARLTIQNRVKLKDRPQQDLNSSERVVLERVPTDTYELSYACLLIPRFSSHLLMGDVEQSLRAWMPDVCVSFGWRLNHITVQREYFEWILSVPAATSPSNCIRTIGGYTSKRILEDFPIFRRENISKDFWAPGFLILAGASPIPLDMINAHIRMTRQQQGILPRRAE